MEASPRKKAPNADTGPCKKLRYTDPDLLVIIKNDVDDEATESKVYHMYAQNLARLSTFVDTSLSVDMREKNEMKITFHNITPDHFEKALQYLEDPLAVRSMTPADALELIPFYDQYQFPGGLLLCDAILSNYVGEQEPTNVAMKLPDDLDLLVQVFSIAHKYSLPKSSEKSVSHLNIRFQDDRSCPFGPSIFSEEHMTMIQPMFQEGLLQVPHGFTNQDLNCSLFPKYFVKCTALKYATKLSQYITLQGTGTHDGKFRKDVDRYIAPFREETVEVRNGGILNGYFRIAKSDLCDNDWAILCSPVGGGPVQHVMWKCPYSKNLTLPPTEPWVPVDTLLVNRKVKIKYC